MQTPQVIPDRGVSDNTLDSSSRPRLRIAPSSIVMFCVVFWVIPLIGLLFTQYLDIVLVIFLAVLFSTFLDPLVNRLERLRIPRAVGILFLYIAILAVIAFVARLALPLFTQETQNLIHTLPNDFRRISAPLNRLGIKLPIGGNGGGKGGLSGLLAGGASAGGSPLSGIAGQAFGIIFSVAQTLVFLLSILVMTFLLTVRRTFTADVVNALAPPAYRQRAVYILSHMGRRMGSWALGQIVITIYYAVVFSLGLTLIHVPYAFSVGVITGVLEIIPFVGGFIGVLLAILVAATVNPFTVILVVILYLIVTNVEAHILVPLVYGRAVHLHPFLVIAALLFGAKAFGLLGALIAVPLAAAIQVGVENLYIKDVVEAAEQREQGPRFRRPNIDLRRLRQARQRQHQ